MSIAKVRPPPLCKEAHLSHPEQAPVELRPRSVKVAQIDPKTPAVNKPTAFDGPPVSQEACAEPPDVECPTAFTETSYRWVRRTFRTFEPLPHGESPRARTSGGGNVQGRSPLPGP